jgi:IS5 family transposase
VTLHYHESVLHAARQEQKSEAFREKILRRPIVERKIAELKRHGLGKARYFGLLKAKLQAVLTAAVVNLKRLARYLAREREPCVASVAL